MYEQLAEQPRRLPTSPLEQLQTQRLKLMELGEQMAHLPDHLENAQQAYNQAGSKDDELRVLEQIRLEHGLSVQLQERYFSLLLEKNPQRLVQLSAAPEGRGDAAVKFLIAHADAKLALPAVETRSASEPAVWRSAYFALTGLYFADQSLPVQNAFASALADGTIGQRLAKTVNRKQALAGDVWFYYASRYGEYLGTIKKGDAEDFLPAEIEHTPTRDAPYFTTALYYEDTGDLNRAIADYQHVVDLNSERIDVHNRLAGIYWKQKRQDQALSEWRRALELLKVQTTTSRTPETFWGDFAATIDNLASRKLLAQFQLDVNEVLHHYVKRNGTYRLQPPLRSALAHAESPAAASALVLELSADAPEKLSFLRQFIPEHSDYKIDQEPVYRRALELAQEAAQKSEGVSKEYAQQEFEGLQVQWFQYLLENKQYDHLRNELAALPKPTWDRRTELVSIQLKLGAQTGGVDAIIAGYRVDPAHAPSAEVLRKAATELQLAGDKPSANKILEFVFIREIEDRNLTAANMLGLAEIRLDSGELEGAVALLRRMTLVVGNPFETQDAAAALLVRTAHPAQAGSFLEELVKAVPWNAQYRGRLAQAQIAAKQNVEAARKDLVSIVSDKFVLYEDRVSFADGLQSAVPASLGSGELDYLAHGGGAAGNVVPDQRLFFAARLKAAKGGPASEQVRLLRGALEDTPGGDAARVPLLKAATEAGDYHLAIAAMQPFLSGISWQNSIDVARDFDDGENATPEWQEENSNRIFAKSFVKEKAEIARDLGTAFEKTGDMDQALPYLQKAYRLEPDPKVKAQLNREVQQIRFTQRRRTANQTRRPEIHSELEQEHLVRPRLPEQTATNRPRPQGQKGGGQ